MFLNHMPFVKGNKLSYNFFYFEILLIKSMLKNKKFIDFQ